MKNLIPAVLLTALALVGAARVASAQDLPKSQPKFLTIIREEIKVGRASDHARHEAGWPAAFEKAKSTDYYVALTSLTGPPVALYLIPSESFAAVGESMKREENDPVLSAELARLAAGDAEFVHSVRTIQAFARPDLSFGDFPDMSKVRFYHITEFRLTPGGAARSRFEALAKAYASARKRVAPQTGIRVYQVSAGAPATTFFGIATAEDYAQFDRLLAEHLAALRQATPEEAAVLEKSGEFVIHEEAHRYRVDPVQSYVAPEARAKDPAFWTRK